MMRKQGFTRKNIIAKAARKVEPFHMVVNFTNVLYALEISGKRTLTKSALENTCRLAVVCNDNVLSKMCFRFKTLLTQVTLEILLCWALMISEMPAQTHLCVKMLLANMTTEFSTVKMVCQVAFELCSVHEIPNGLTQFALYFQRAVTGRLLYILIFCDIILWLITIMYK